MSSASQGKSRVVALRHVWLWMLIGWLLVAGIILASVIPDVRLAVLSSGMSDKIAHGFSYFLLMLWFSGLYMRRYQLVVAVSVIVLGMVLEAIQWQLPYRMFDLNDLLANLIGVASGFIFAILLSAGWCQRIEMYLGYHD